MIEAFLLIFGTACFGFVVWDYLDVKKLWTKVEYKVAALACLGVYVMSAFMFAYFYFEDRLVMLKVPAMLFAIACILLLAIMKGKFPKKDC